MLLIPSKRLLNDFVERSPSSNLTGRPALLDFVEEGGDILLSNEESGELVP